MHIVVHSHPPKPRPPVKRTSNTLGNAPETETASRVNVLHMHHSLLRRVQGDLELHLGLAEGHEMYATIDSRIF